MMHLDKRLPIILSNDRAMHLELVHQGSQPLQAASLKGNIAPPPFG